MFAAQFGAADGPKVLAKVRRGAPVRIGGQPYVLVADRLEPAGALSTAQQQNAMLRAAAFDLAGLANYAGLTVNTPKHWLLAQSAGMSIATLAAMPPQVVQTVYPSWVEGMLDID